MRKIKKILSPVLILMLVLSLLVGCGSPKSPEAPKETAKETVVETVIETEAETEAAAETEIETEVYEEEIAYDGEYTSKEDVALYLYTYGELPVNFITKKEAQALGWDNKKGNLWDVAPGMSIGGDHFGNYEELLPKKKGRQYTECDINYEGGYRGPERIVFSNDGLIYYSASHYEDFELLYGEE